MKKSFHLAIFTSLTIIFFSCATARPVSTFVEEKNLDGETVTMTGRPDVAAERDVPQEPALFLPEVIDKKTPVDSHLRVVWGRFAFVLQNMMRVAKTRQTAATETVHNSAPVENTRTSVEKTSPPAPPHINYTEPSVQPVVNTAPVSSTSDRVRTIYARLGDDIEISFKENGWLLLELPDDKAGLEFISRSTEGGATVFKFHGSRMGTFVLPFQFQDHVRGIMRREIIQIKVVPETEFDTVMGSRHDDGDMQAKLKRREYADRLYELGNYRDALQEYLAAYSEGDPALNEIIASLALAQKDYKNAGLYWKKNLRDKGAFRDKAIMGLVRAYMGTDDKSALISHIKLLLTVKDFPIEDELAVLIRYFDGQKDDTQLFDLVQEYLARFPFGSNCAEIYFLLGKLYERHPTIRDFKKARDCYTRVVKEYPSSPYLFPAKERIEYLNRHYFRVQ